MDYIEVGFGYGYGYFSKDEVTDESMLMAAKKNLKNSKLAVLIFPDKCPMDKLNFLVNLNVDLVRIAVQSNNPLPAEKYIKFFRENNIEVGGFLMMAYKVNAETLLESVNKLIDFGAENICITDLAGYMGPKEVFEKVSKISENVSVTISFHTHDNLGLAVGNSMIAINAGANTIDTSLGGIGAGAGNTPSECMVATLNKDGIPTNSDLFKMLDAFEVLYPIASKYGLSLKRREDALMLGYTGVYSTFMKPAREASEKYGVDYRILLQKAADKKLVAGEENQLELIAKQLKK